jgi:hypothetical protein
MSAAKSGRPGSSTPMPLANIKGSIPSDGPEKSNGREEEEGIERAWGLRVPLGFRLITNRECASRTMQSPPLSRLPAAAALCSWHATPPRGGTCATWQNPAGWCGENKFFFFLRQRLLFLFLCCRGRRGRDGDDPSQSLQPEEGAGGPGTGSCLLACSTRREINQTHWTDG